jgi:hypothetical protein
MSESKRTLRVFLCYAHSDRETVRNLYNKIMEAGIHAWLDTEDLQPGQNWQHEIRKAILKSTVVIVCLSREFNKQHGYRHEELKLALEKKKLLDDENIFIIPVRLEQCDMPESLRSLHRVDLFEKMGYQKLIRALQKMESQNNNLMSP